MTAGEAVVCGFADEATDLAGLVWELPGGRGALLARRGEIGSGEARIEPAGAGVGVRFEAGALRCEAKLSPRAAESTLSAAEGEAVSGNPRAAICEANVRVGADAGRTIHCPGHLTRWSASPTGGAELLRHLAIPALAGTLLVLAARPEGDGSQDAERVLAWELDAEGAARPFGDALLSTQYDGGGLQTRAGLELWPLEGAGPPLRAAGSVREGQVFNGDRVTGALLHSSAEGTTGIGTYLIWRA